MGGGEGYVWSRHVLRIKGGEGRWPHEHVLPITSGPRHTHIFTT